jgi:hypothetical protein
MRNHTGAFPPPSPAGKTAGEGSGSAQPPTWDSQNTVAGERGEGGGRFPVSLMHALIVCRRARESKESPAIILATMFPRVINWFDY